MTDQERSAGQPPGEAPQHRGGCLNLGWGCLPVLAAIFFVPSVGLWFV